MLILLVLLEKFGYDEIDLAAYIEQMDLYNNNEKNYKLLTSHNGPVTYPAGYVHLYSILRRLFLHVEYEEYPAYF
jgi:alpha-1,3-mannosyltransferase